MCRPICVSLGRGSHDVDVFVSFERAGVVVNWIIECKHWKRPVDKSHVLTLRSIVEDVGAIGASCFPSLEPSVARWR